MAKKARTPWSACPNCFSDLRTYDLERKCPFCGTPIEIIWWECYLFTGIGLSLAIGIPLLIGVRDDFWFLFILMVSGSPIVGITFVVLAELLPLKYERRIDSLTLFPR